MFAKPHAFTGLRFVAYFLISVILTACWPNDSKQATKASQPSVNWPEKPASASVPLAERFVGLNASLGFTRAEKPSEAVAQDMLRKGEQLSAKYCTGCHLRPLPEHLKRSSWLGFLPRLLVGLSARKLVRFQLPDRLAVPADSFPQKMAGRHDKWDAPYPGYQLSQADFTQIAFYYFVTAPDAFAMPAKQPIAIERAPFATAFALPIAAGSAQLFGPVMLDTAKRLVLIGEAREHIIMFLDWKGGLVSQREMPGVVEALSMRAKRYVATLIAPNLESNDTQAGSVVEFGEKTPATVLASRLSRPVDSAFIDYNGRDGLMVAEYGLFSGSLSYFAAGDSGAWKFQQRVFDGVGAVALQTGDFDGDAKADVVAIIGHNEETIKIITRQAGKFSFVNVRQFPPSWGLTSVAGGDFNGDGVADIAVTNGDDKGTYGGPFPYHGVRVYMGLGEKKFTDSFFYPMPGAVQVKAGDYDRDGDIDLVAIASFPDAEAPVGIVFLENRQGAFSARLFSDGVNERWAYLADGDMDGDGDLDLALAGEILVSELDDPNTDRSKRFGYMFLRNESPGRH